MFGKVKDPVCGKQIRKKEAIVLEHHSKLYYFCTPECKDKFHHNPKKYVKDTL